MNFGEKGTASSADGNVHFFSYGKLLQKHLFKKNMTFLLTQLCLPGLHHGLEIKASVYMDIRSLEMIQRELV